MPANTFLVTQATGEQSKWVITHLLQAGAKVHAVVRDLTKAPVLLHHPNITLFQGESKSFDDIYTAAQGCKGAFLNTFPIPGLEALQAQTIVAACEKAGVESLVACTTYLTGQKSRWDNEDAKKCLLEDYFTSKTQVEAAVRGSSIKAYTILRPAILFQDFYLPGAYGNYPRLAEGVLDHAFNDGIKGPFTDAHDVGAYASAALLDPARFHQQEIDLASQALTIAEAHKLLEKASGQNIKLHRRTAEEEEDGVAAIFGQRFQLWSNVETFDIDSTAEKTANKYGVQFTTLEAALQRDRERLTYLAL
ncbi:hypothetical protein VHEMI02847 [[Torrubiella] hemipterigena]|uniref:NmrA-like domain-containing protein n=1 Tax=[Torrubiella] hemipterigena TaxID=1531966 RepID=A0A0A1TBP4_9HYPO|nr:hypothetical protein VHEMI02847 [[Torrubiella] hemipterigena]